MAKSFKEVEEGAGVAGASKWKKKSLQCLDADSSLRNEAPNISVEYFDRRESDERRSKLRCIFLQPLSTALNSLVAEYGILPW